MPQKAGLKRLTDREQWLFWRLARFFMQKFGYRLVHINDMENELWLESPGHKQIQLIRIALCSLDWSNWLKRDIEQAGEQAERMRQHLFRRDLRMLNMYVSEFPPVDDYEWVIHRPAAFGNGKTKVETLIIAKGTVQDAFMRLEALFSQIPVPENAEGDEAETRLIKESVLRQAREQEERERALFGYGKPFFTYVFMAVQIFMFFLLEINGGSLNVDTLIRFGAKYNPLILDGEWWRFFTPIFLHIGILHLMMNTLALYYLGNTVERMFGRLRFLWIYLFSGFSGSVASFLFTDNLSAGASGAIFGCFGALLYVGIMNARLFFRTIGMNVLVLIGINLVFGFTVPGIDNAGHIGGLAGGFLATGIVHFPKQRKRWTQMLFFIAALAAVILALYCGFYGELPVGAGV
jgi:rhomboid protease GluP